MTTTEVKTSDLSGEALNWAVGLAEGLNMFVAPTVYGVPARAFVNRLRGETVYGQRYDPANDWAIGGPLLDLNCKGFGVVQDGRDMRWRAFAYNGESGMQRLAGGESILIAACRAIVLLRLGETVSVPAELMP